MRRIFKYPLLVIGIAACAMLPVAEESAVNVGSSRWVWQNPLPQGNTLNAISCPSATLCYAVGVQGTILATNDGTHWNGQNSTTNVTLRGISCPSTTVCVAVGDGGMILFTNTSGAAWSRQSAATTAPLTGVSCLSTNLCFAVGPSAGIWFTGRLGSSGWERPLASPSSGLVAISCPNPASASAICYLAGGKTLARLFNLMGRFWFIADIPIPPISSSLSSISCPSAGTCAAVAGQSNGSSANIIETSDEGKSWLPVTLPANIQLNSISCVNPPSSLPGAAPLCYAAGHAGGANNAVFAGHLNSVIWDSIPAGQTTKATLNGISCQPALVPGATGPVFVSMCFAVGGFGSIVTNTPSGDTWTPQQTSIGGSSLSLGVFSGASCPTLGTCFVVGNGVYASVDNGPWSLLNSTVNGSAISCPSATQCIVVGLGKEILVSTDGGTTWTQRYPTGVPSSALTSISCPSTQVCVAAGNPNSFYTVNGGTVWNLFPPGTIGGANSVSCPTTTSCMAVFPTGILSPNAIFSFTTNLDSAGGTWTAGFSPVTDNLLAVSCPNVTTCVAVGDSGGLGNASAALLFGTFSGATWGWEILTPPLPLGDALLGIGCAQPFGSPIQCSAGTVAGELVQLTTIRGLPSVTLDATIDPGIRLPGMSCVGLTNAPRYQCVAAGNQGAILTKTVELSRPL